MEKNIKKNAKIEKQNLTTNEINILLVDDEEDVALLLKEGIEIYGYYNVMYILIHCLHYIVLNLISTI